MRSVSVDCYLHLECITKTVMIHAYNLSHTCGYDDNILAHKLYSFSPSLNLNTVPFSVIVTVATSIRISSYVSTRKHTKNDQKLSHVHYTPYLVFCTVVVRSYCLACYHFR